MLEEKELENIEENKQKELEEGIDKALMSMPLDQQEEEIVQKILLAPTQKELQEQFNLFNIAQSKKNALRIIKLNNLLDKVEDQAIERFEERPYNVSNKELLEYMQVVSNQIDRSQKYIDSLKDVQMVSVKNQKNEVNINIGTNLNADSKERVINAINSLLKQLNTNEDIIDADVQESVTVDAYKNDEGDN